MQNGILYVAVFSEKPRPKGQIFITDLLARELGAEVVTEQPTPRLLCTCFVDYIFIPSAPNALRIPYLPYWLWLDALFVAAAALVAKESDTSPAF
jgi:hypothetical protein